MREDPAARGGDAPQRRGTPPGSLRYFAVLFAEPASRAQLHAFYAFEAELRDTAASANHDIAHTRLRGGARSSRCWPPADRDTPLRRPRTRRRALAACSTCCTK